jgi:hypothetical protein
MNRHDTYHSLRLIVHWRMPAVGGPLSAVSGNGNSAKKRPILDRREISPETQRPLVKSQWPFSSLLIADR